jgi:hypothetical protein
MAGLVPAIHVFVTVKKDVDARDKRGHDESFVATSFLHNEKARLHGGLPFTQRNTTTLTPSERRSSR